MKRLAILLAATAASCHASCSSGEPPRTTQTQADTTSSAQEAAYPLITPQGIGGVSAGATVADARAALPSGQELGGLIPLFMVDLSAIPVLSGADTLYYLVFEATDRVGDSDRPLFVATDHEGLRTAEGVGPGMLLTEAARVYGPPRLHYSVHDEMREYASFPEQPSERVHFRVRSPDAGAALAGDYATDEAYNETDIFDARARIGLVLVTFEP